MMIKNLPKITALRSRKFISAIPLAICSVSAIRIYADVETSKPMPLLVTTGIIMGKQEATARFNPDTYGKTRGFNAAAISKPVIAVYTKSLNSNLFKLAAAVDKLIIPKSALDESFVQFADETGAQQGGYTAPQVAARLREVRAEAEKDKIKQISFAISATGSASFVKRLGLTAKNDAMIVVLNPVKGSYPSPTVDWQKQFVSTDLTPESIAEIVKEAKSHVPSP